MLQLLIDAAVVAAIWFFFGATWGMAALVAGLFFAALGWWMKSTNERIANLEKELIAIRTASR